jgi:hypothetical protein
VDIVYGFDRGGAACPVSAMWVVTMTILAAVTCVTALLRLSCEELSCSSTRTTIS